jgi:hypothetical protein
MPRINFTVNLRVGRNTQPLKRVYVEHIAFGLRVPGSQLYMTDDSGRVRDAKGNLGIDAIPNLLNGRIDVRIICHNSVVKIPNGILDHFRDFSIADGATVTITTANSPNNFNHFRIVNRCIEVYDNVLRQFQVFNSEFPLGKKNTLDNTRKSRKRIEVAFPSSIVVKLAFVEPKSIHTGFPVIHIGNRDGRFPIDNPNNRLFGSDPMLIPAELSHALHFSHLSETQRHDITVKYGKFIVTDFLLGGGGTHFMLKDTDPMVAFVEAFDHFVHRFDRFIRDNPNLTGVPLRNGFIRSELNSSEQFDRNTRGFGTLAGNLSTGNFTPNPAFLTRGRNSATSIEGSIYGAIFLDFARRPGVGLRTAVNAYIRSKALSFGEFRTWVRRNLPNLRTQLDDVLSTWTL